MKKLGFTLAEVLITLVIIGVIAAMAIPVVMNNTNAQEYKTGLKKSVEILNNALQMEYAVNGRTAQDFTFDNTLGENDGTRGDGNGLIKDLFGARLNVMIPSGGAAVAGCDGGKLFGTADGMLYCVSAFEPGNCDSFNRTACGTIYVDVNGLKKPNVKTDDANRPRDVYVLEMYDQKVQPGDAVSQEVMYDKSEQAAGAAAGGGD